MQQAAGKVSPPLASSLTAADYWQAGAPSVVAGATAAVFTKIAQVTKGLVRLTFVIVALHPPPFTVGPPNRLPVVAHQFTVPTVGGVVHDVVVLYLTESAKNASSAVTRFRRSDFIEAMYAFALVLANFGIAMAARMPMITTTMRSSMSVKPLRFIMTSPPLESLSAGTEHPYSGVSRW